MDILKRYFSLLIGIIVFIVYLFTLAPSVIQIDSGELTAVQVLAGIAHPTGYPLFTITGYLFSLLPLPFSKVVQMNLLAALFCAAGTTVFIQASRLMLDNIHSFIPVKKEAVKIKGKKKTEVKTAPISVSQSKVIAASAAGGLILAFSRTFWFQSTSVEVYSLQILLFSIILYTLIKAYINEDEAGAVSLRSPWISFACALALGFSNHMTTLLILPGTAYLYFNKYGFNKPAFKRIGIMLLVFFPLLIVIYSYLPIRAAAGPAVNWGNPVNWENIMRHISGQQYQVWLFSSADAAKKQLSYFIASLPVEFGINLFIAAAGLIAAFITARKAFLFILITFLFAVLYSINYDINDIDAYFIPAYFALALFSVFGVVKLMSLLKMENKKHYVSGGLISLFIIVQTIINFPKADQSGTYLFEDYTKAVLNSTEENSIILTYQWDYFISPSYYFQFVEDFRRDAAVVDKELLRRSWYFNQLNTAYPGLLSGLETEIEMFKNALAPFERGEAHDPALLERLYQTIMTKLISLNIDKRDIYIASELVEGEMQRGELRLPEGLTIVPHLLLFKVVKNAGYVPAPDTSFTFRVPEKGNIYTENIQHFAGAMLARRAVYEMQRDNRDKAEMYISKIKKDMPAFILPPGLEQVIEK